MLYYIQKQQNKDKKATSERQLKVVNSFDVDSSYCLIGINASLVLVCCHGNSIVSYRAFFLNLALKERAATIPDCVRLIFF